MMSADKVREFYRRQGEERERQRLIALLMDKKVLRRDGIVNAYVFINCNTLEVLYLKDDLVKPIDPLEPEAKLDQLQSEAFNGGKGIGCLAEQNRVIEIIEKHGKVCNFESVHEHPCDVCAYLQHLVLQIKDPNFTVNETANTHFCECRWCDLEPEKKCYSCSEACMSCQDKFYEDCE